METQKYAPRIFSEELISLLATEETDVMTVTLLDLNFSKFVDALSHVKVPLYHEGSFRLVLFEDLKITKEKLRQGIESVRTPTFKKDFDTTTKTNEQDLALLKIFFHENVVTDYLKTHLWQDLHTSQALLDLSFADQKHIETQIPKLQVGVGKGAWKKVFKELFKTKDENRKTLKKFLKSVKKEIISKSDLSKVQIDLALTHITTRMRKYLLDNGTKKFHEKIENSFNNIMYAFKISKTPPTNDNWSDLAPLLYLPNKEYFFFLQKEPLKASVIYWEGQTKQALLFPYDASTCCQTFDCCLRIPETSPRPFDLLQISSIEGGSLLPFLVFFIEAKRCHIGLRNDLNKYDALLQTLQFQEPQKELEYDDKTRSFYLNELLKTFDTQLASKFPRHLLSVQLFYHMNRSYSSMDKRYDCLNQLRLLNPEPTSLLHINRYTDWTYSITYATTTRQSVWTRIGY